MSDTKIYIGSYKSTSENLFFNRVKYTTICSLLDYFAIRVSAFKERLFIEKDALVNMVLNNTDIVDTENNRKMIETAICHMVMIGLLSQNGNVFTITDGGACAFREHTFHKILYDINAQKKAKELSMTAIFISLLTLISSIVLYFFAK